MAFEVQDPTTPTSTANSYISVDEFKDYHDDRGGDYSAMTDPEIEQALVRATDYMDIRWEYQGYDVDSDQSTQVPRDGVYDNNGYLIEGIPNDIKKACAEYAMIAADQDLAMNPTQNAGGIVKSLREKVDVIETEVVYKDGVRYAAPIYPIPDGFMKASGLISSGFRRQLSRG